jgi:hypothetical protein
VTIPALVLPLTLPMHTQTVCVAGTNDWSDDQSVRWYCKGSPFIQLLERRGMCPFFTPDCGDPFIWSTDLGGIGFGNSDHKVWAAAGRSLKNFCVPPLAPHLRIPKDQLQIITHSHGVQVALYAAAAGLKIDRLISVTGPVRRDMEPVIEKARPNIRYWRHVWTGGDWWQLMGGLFDRRLGVTRKFKQADNNVKIPGIGHSGLFRDPSFLAEWEWLI